MEPLVAIAILNWNGKKFLEQFLPSVLASSYSNYMVVVIDNASTDDSVPFVQQQYPQVKIVRNERNYGFAKGYNEGLKQVQADYFILLNSDVEVVKGWIEPVIWLMESDARIGACQPKILQYRNRQLFEYAGASGGWLDHLGYPFARGRIFDICEEDTGQYDDPAPIFWASGAALFVRARLYRELGGLDEYFFAHQEEIDFCWRLQLHGYRVFVCPASKVYHVGGGTLPKGNAMKVFLNFRNNLIMMAKNLPAGEGLIKIGCRFWLDGISALKSLLVGEITYSMAVIQSHFAFLAWLLINRRKSIFPATRHKDLEGYWRKSVVWAYFIKGKNTFRSIVRQDKGTRQG